MQTWASPLTPPPPRAMPTFMTYAPLRRLTCLFTIGRIVATRGTFRLMNLSHFSQRHVYPIGLSCPVGSYSGSRFPLIIRKSSGSFFRTSSMVASGNFSLYCILPRS